MSGKHPKDTGIKSMHTPGLIIAFSYLAMIRSNESPQQAQPSAICVKKGVHLPTVQEVTHKHSESFLQMILKSNAWVDKTLLLRELAESEEKYVILTWPHSCGKTINLWMMKLYFGIPTDEESVQCGISTNEEFVQSGVSKRLQLINPKESEGYLFFKEGLIYDRNNEIKIQLEEKPLIATYPNIDEHLQKYPVILLDLKAMHGYADSLSKFKKQTSHAFKSHEYMLERWRTIVDNNSLNENDKKEYENKIEKYQKYQFYKLHSNDSELEWQKGIKFLIKELREYHDKKVMILIDEYDSYFKHIYIKSYDDINRADAILLKRFFTSFYLHTFKKNPDVHKVIMTGTTRFAEKTIFTSINEFLYEANYFRMCELSTYYGIRTEEFEILANRRNLSEKTIAEAIRRYDGYNAINVPQLRIINTWNTIMFINTGRIQDYWTKLGMDMDWIPNLLKHPKIIKVAFELVAEKPYEIRFCSLARLDAKWATDLHKFLQWEQINTTDEAVEATYAFLAQIGHLTPVANQTEMPTDTPTPFLDQRFSFVIPNEEVKSIFEYAVKLHFKLTENNVTVINSENNYSTQSTGNSSVNNSTKLPRHFRSLV